jgi:hypothetical protein
MLHANARNQAVDRMIVKKEMRQRRKARAIRAAARIAPCAAHSANARQQATKRMMAKEDKEGARIVAEAESGGERGEGGGGGSSSSGGGGGE